MSTPTIPAGNLFMNATLWTGDGTSSRAITNGASGQTFQPDLVWSKVRNNTYGHMWFDSVRGAGGNKELGSNSTGAEGYASSSVYGYTSSFNSNGFTVTAGTDGSIPNAYTNQSSLNYVAWQWKAGGTAVSNTSGSITSSVSANTTSGFSVVTYTLNNSTFTVGHGLGVAPQLIMVKDRDTTNNWDVYHVSVGAGSRIVLNAAAVPDTSSQVWNNTAPTSTVFSGNSAWWSNPSTSKMVAYCWAPVAGYSQFGSYTGNGSTDGPFIYTGFRPRWVFVKGVTSGGAGDWQQIDTSQNPYNAASYNLFFNDSRAGGALGFIADVNSNGFKIRDSDGFSNNSGSTYIYAAFAENPFKYANAR